MGTKYLWREDELHPPSAEFVPVPGAEPLGFFHAWSIPPKPWPHLDRWQHYDPAVWGPPGTVWTFTQADVIDRLATGLDGGNLLQRFARLLQKLGVRFVNGVGNWAVPLGATFDRNDPEWSTVKTVSVVIHGKLGTVEEVAHTFHLVHSTDPNFAADVPAMKALATKLSTQWLAFLEASADNSAGKVRGYMPTELQYDYVSCRYVDQPPAARPVELVPTQYQAFGPGTGGTNQFNVGSLPWEVAMAVGLNTNFRGPRFRGRTYLGPFTNNVMGGAGTFSSVFSTKVATALGANFIAPVNTDTPWDFHVLSRKFGTSAPIQGTRAGVVPDSQRRRRRSQPELMVQGWGTAIGGAA